jgi:hypothetical protein
MGTSKIGAQAQHLRPTSFSLFAAGSFRGLPQGAEHDEASVAAEPDELLWGSLAPGLGYKL